MDALSQLSYTPIDLILPLQVKNANGMVVGFWVSNLRFCSTGTLACAPFANSSPATKNRTGKSACATYAPGLLASNHLSL